MLKLSILPLLAMASLSYGQVFNHVQLSADFEDISRQSGFSYVLMNSEHFGVYKLDENGSFIDADTLALFTSSALPLPLSEASLHMLADSTFLVYGSYIVGCDVISETGSFVAHYDRDLHLLNSQVFIDSNRNFSQSPELYPMGTGQYAMAMHSGLIGFDDSLNQSYFKPWEGDDIYGSAAISDQLILEVSRKWNDTTTASYLHNVNTGTVGPAPQMEGRIFNVNDTTFARKESSFLYLHRKADFQVFDSIHMSSTIGFQHEYIQFQPDAILFAEEGRYAIVSVDNLQLIEADSLHTTSKFSGALSYKDSILAAAINAGSGTGHIESIDIHKPKAPVVDHISLAVENTRLEVGSISAQAPSVRTVYSSNDWQLTLVNHSPDTIHELAIKYYTQPNFYCLPYIDLLHQKNLNLSPLDTLTIELDSVSHANTIFGADYTSWLNVAVVMANENIVKTNGWVQGSKTIKNVDIAEHALAPQEVQIFPNPTSDVLHFQFDETFTGSVAMYSLTGQLLKKVALYKQQGETHTFHLTAFPSGIYLVQIESEGRVFQKKVIRN